jgi:hypothetical protein
MSDVSIALELDQISRCEKPIRPYVRCTSIMEINGAPMWFISGGNTTAVNFDQ